MSETREDINLQAQHLADDPVLLKKNIQRIGQEGLLIAPIASIVCVGMYLLTQAWQNLAVGVLVLMCGGLFWLARSLSQRGRSDSGGWLIILVVVTLFPASALFWAGASLSLAIVTVGFTYFLSLLVIPLVHRQRVLIIGVIMAAAAFTPDLLFRLPWPRFDLNSAVITMLVPYALLAAVVGLLCLELVRAYRTIKTLVLRMRVAFALIVIFSSSVIALTSILIGLRNTEQQVMDQLNAVSSLEQAALAQWEADLHAVFVALTVDTDGYAQALSGTAVGALQRQALREQFQRIVAQTQQFAEIFVLDTDGEVILSTDILRENKILYYESFFQQGLRGKYLQPPTSDAAGRFSLFLAYPLMDQDNAVLGVLVGRIDVQSLNTLMNTGVMMGETGEAYLVGINRVLLTQTRFKSGRYLESSGVLQALTTRGAFSGRYQDYHGNLTLGVVTWLPTLQVALAVEKDLSELRMLSVLTGAINLGAAVAALGLAWAISLFFSADISRPLSGLADVVRRVAEGDYTLQADVTRVDEIGMLAQNFNKMTTQLRGLIGGLEQRVEERTRGLQAVAEVSRATTSILDMDQLLPRVVNLVLERFDLYYVGLFLTEEATGGDTARFAVLRAGTGDAGRQMLAQGWRLQVGGESMIGQCVVQGRAIIKQTAGDTVARFENPWLPHTRSELALPLRYGDRVIGAMTVQSTQDAAFDEVSLSLLQNMADQVAVAVENANLFAETQLALERAYEVQRRYLGQAWEQYLRLRTITGYERRDGGVHPIESGLLPESARVLAAGHPVAEPQQLLVPILQNERVMGVIGVEKSGQNAWSADDVALLESLAEQLMLAAENQRLMDETLGRATREQLTREISDEILRAVGVESLLRTAVASIGERLGAPRTYVRLTLADDAAAQPAVPQSKGTQPLRLGPEKEERYDESR